MPGLTETTNHWSALLAWEGAAVGAGGGWTFGPERPVGGGLAAYLRIGPLDAVHLRAELRPVTATPGVTGWARAGIAVNQGQRGGVGGFVGMSVAPGGTDEVFADVPPRLNIGSRPAFFADATFGLGRALAVFVRLQKGKRLGGAGIGIRGPWIR
ncbi:MAG: hypothetical protein AAB409_05660 [Gemmatimonadota bacterium]